jgi:dienelactone hydrolase
LALATPTYRAYRVLVDVTEGIEVYGNLLVPTGSEGRRPAVVCQHGLSGTPEDITGLGRTKDTAYHEFGRKLAEQGYVVFAPLILHYHPPSWTNDQARLADAVGMMRVALAAAQTRRVVDFLQGLPFVDPKKIGYYGLSYGGYSALWIPPGEPRLKAVVVSGHFNDWRSKITSEAITTSYLFHPDEDFYNWDVLHRLTHAELVLAMSPRPVCIEWGRRDDVTPPAWLAYAWGQLAAVRDRLGLQETIILAEFDGVHEIRGTATFAFLDHFLRHL